jgi:hypothetical protein
MNDALDILIERAKRVVMTPVERSEQRISFAYGNANIENESITKDMVVSLSEKISFSK